MDSPEERAGHVQRLVEEEARLLPPEARAVLGRALWAAAERAGAALSDVVGQALMAAVLDGHNEVTRKTARVDFDAAAQKVTVEFETFKFMVMVASAVAPPPQDHPQDPHST